MQINRLRLRHQEVRLGLLAAIKHGIKFQEAIPADLWETWPGPLADFVKKEWQAWKDEIAEKTSDLRDLEAWLQSLNEKRTGRALD